jgi:hypothetical protein
VASGAEALMAELSSVLGERLVDHILTFTPTSVEQASRLSGAPTSPTSPPPGPMGTMGGVVVLRLPERIVSRLQRPQCFETPEVLVDACPDLEDAVVRLGIVGPTVLVPLNAGIRRVGVLALAYLVPADEAVADFTRRVLVELAPILAHSLARARFQDLEEEIADSFQRSMLEPAATKDPRLPVVIHYETGVEQLQAGGDWHDVVPLAEGRVALVVGDVVGSGLAAATVMGRLRAAARALLLAGNDPAQVLSHLDAFVGTVDGGRFTTCFCVVVDPKVQTASYSSAGHPPALVVTADGAASFLWGAQGPPLSVVSGQRPQAGAAFAVGSRLLLYTDGLIERRGESIDRGFERLAGLAAVDDIGPVGAGCARLWETLRDGAGRHDDMAMVCAKLVSSSAVVFARRLTDAREVFLAGVRDLQAWLEGHGLEGPPAREAALAAFTFAADTLDRAGEGEVVDPCLKVRWEPGALRMLVSGGPDDDAVVAEDAVVLGEQVTVNLNQERSIAASPG